MVFVVTCSLGEETPACRFQELVDLDAGYGFPIGHGASLRFLCDVQNQRLD